MVEILVFQEWRTCHIFTMTLLILVTQWRWVGQCPLEYLFFSVLCVWPSKGITVWKIYWLIETHSLSLRSELLLALRWFGKHKFTDAYMGYWPNVRSRWLDTGEVLLLGLYAPRRVQLHEQAKKTTWPISSHLDQTSLVNKGFIVWLSENLFCRTHWVIPGR